MENRAPLCLRCTQALHVKPSYDNTRHSPLSHPLQGTVYDAVDKPVDFPSIFKGKKVVLTGLPGAFTPTCSATHLPSYIKKHEEIKGKGVDEIVCLTVNDPFVAVAWSESTGATGKVSGVHRVGDHCNAGARRVPHFA